MPAVVPRQPMVLAVGLAIALMCLLPHGLASSHTPPPGTGEALIVMHEDGDTGDATLRYTLLASLAVTQAEAGAREVAVPLPERASLDSLAPSDTLFPAPDAVRTEERAGRDWAVAKWSDEGPQTGEWAGMRLEAREELETHRNVAVEWVGLPQNLTMVRVFLPESHLPVMDAAYGLERAQQTGGLVGWNLTEPPSGGLHFTIRAIDPGDDPALADPPHPLNGFLILIGLAAAASLLWFVGKKMDARMRRD